MKSVWPDLWFPPINLWNVPRVDYSRSLLSDGQRAAIADWKTVQSVQRLIDFKYHAVVVPQFLRKEL